MRTTRNPMLAEAATEWQVNTIAESILFVFYLLLLSALQQGIIDK